MGFFSSIGKVFSSVAKPVLGVVGGILGNNAQQDAAAQAQSNYEQQAAFAREQFEYQKALHQNQMQWRVEDAKKAGLHPMAALGLSSMQFSPVSGASYSGSSPTDYSWIGDLGQNLDYAATKGKTNAQQEAAFALAQKSGEVQLEGLELDNEFKRMQIMEMASRLVQSGPAAPDLNGGNNLIGGQNDSPFPHGNTYTDNTRPLLELGRIGDTLVEYINPDLADSVNEDMLKKLAVRIASEGQNARTALQAFRHFTKREQAAVLRGDADIVRDFLTGSWQFKWKPHMRSRKNSDGSISGKIIW